jgi:hypothetical protein
MSATMKPLIPLFLFLLSTEAAYAQNKPYRLPPVDLKQRVIWGSECIVDENLGLRFGGLDQEGGDPTNTFVRTAGQWEVVRIDCPSPYTDRRLARAAKTAAELNAILRRWHFEQALDEKQRGSLPTDLNELRRQVQSLAKEVAGFAKHANDVRQPLASAVKLLETVSASLESLPALDDIPEPRSIATLDNVRIALEQASLMVGFWPGARALSPIVYDKESNLFVLFGGDHLDYLTNDTWVFDPKYQSWRHRHPTSAPPPRANHKLTAKGDGTITFSGGYTYANNTDYMGGQYVDIGDGEWTYDIAKNEWSGGKGASSLTRTYRTGKFHPDYFLQGPRPDRAAHQKVLDELPANQWVSLQPPHLPEMNRDWGTAVLDPDRDLILRWSGGHCAHSGSDVLHYHIATNRWELPFPVEFPLGQCYVNTEFPEGVNFNGRPWVTGHTYQSYGYHPQVGKMVFAGRDRDCFLYDPDVADWSGRFPKPKGMSYDSCFYTLTLTPTSHGLICWTQEGRIFQLDPSPKLPKWNEHELSGEKLPGAVVDNSTIVYDSKRHRLLTVSKSYGDNVTFSGELFAIDCASWKVTRLKPEGREAAAAIPYLCQLRYDAEHDLLLVGGTLPPDNTGLRRTPAYDCAGNRWVSLKITGDDPSGAKGRNVSLGVVYDAKRKLFFAVDTKSNVFALRLEPQSADAQPLK